MSDHPLLPRAHVGPERIAHNTFVVHQVQDALGQPLLAPWLSLVDPTRFDGWCDRIEKLAMSTVVSAHAPLITAASVAPAFGIVRALPGAVPPPAPSEVDFKAMIAAAAAA
jgi:hypothetical protein